MRAECFNTDPALVWNTAVEDSAAKPSDAQYSADLGIQAAEQFESLSQQTMLAAACPERPARMQTPVQQAAKSTRQILQQVKPRSSATTAGQQIRHSCKMNQERQRQSVTASTSRPCPRHRLTASLPSGNAAVLPSSGAETCKADSLLQLQPDRWQSALAHQPAAPARSLRVQTVDKMTFQSHSHVAQPPTRLANIHQAAAVNKTSMTRPAKVTQGQPRGQKRSRVAVSEQALGRSISPEDPDTPDLEEAPPQAFHKNKKHKRMAVSSFRIGDIVWIKYGEYPWWPAQVRTCFGSCHTW